MSTCLNSEKIGSHYPQCIYWFHPLYVGRHLPHHCCPTGLTDALLTLLRLQVPKTGHCVSGLTLMSSSPTWLPTLPTRLHVTSPSPLSRCPPRILISYSGWPYPAVLLTFNHTHACLVGPHVMIP